MLRLRGGTSFLFRADHKLVVTAKAGGMLLAGTGGLCFNSRSRIRRGQELATRIITRYTMKTEFNIRTLSAGWLFASAAILLASSVRAQVNSAPSPADSSPSPHSTPAANAGRDSNSVNSPNPSGNTGAAQLARSGPASELLHMRVENEQGELLGRVDELAVDMASARLVYAIVDRKMEHVSKEDLAAVPPSSLEPKADGKALIFKGDAKQLADAPGFTSDTWDKELGAEQIGSVYRAFGSKPEGSVSGLKVERASKVIGMGVRNLSDQSLGKVSDLLIDIGSARIDQVVLASGGVLGMGTDYYVLAPDSLNYENALKVLHLDRTKQSLSQLPHYQKRSWSEAAAGTRVTSSTPGDHSRS